MQKNIIKFLQELYYTYNYFFELGLIKKKFLEKPNEKIKINVKFDSRMLISCKLCFEFKAMYSCTSAIS